MTDSSTSELIVHNAELEALRGDFARDVREGLSAPEKSLSCRWFYDDEGSALFERICELPEYYLTRAETEILEQAAPNIAESIGNRVLVELGSGNSSKTRLILEALLARRDELAYVPIDIDRGILESSARNLIETYPGLAIDAVAGEYGPAVARANELFERPKCLVWLGSSIGNFDPRDALGFLRSAIESSRSGDRDALLIGFDLVKSREALERAYDDAQGVTAEFNRNILRRINRELGANFEVERFAHRARFLTNAGGSDAANRDGGRVVMELVSEVVQSVRIDKIDLTVEFAAGEMIHTESSQKWTLDGIDALARELGLHVLARWLDDEKRFALALFGRSNGGKGA